MATDAITLAFPVPETRGLGIIGTRLLDAIKDRARELGKAYVLLAVINRNRKARAHYERQGLLPGDTEEFGPFGRLFGFSHATITHFAISDPEQGSE